MNRNYLFITAGKCDALCDIADLVEEHYGAGAVVVTVGHGTRSALYADRTHPRWHEANAYAASLVEGAKTSREAFRAAIR